MGCAKHENRVDHQHRDDFFMHLFSLQGFFSCLETNMLKLAARDRRIKQQRGNTVRTEMGEVQKKIKKS